MLRSSCQSPSVTALLRLLPLHPRLLLRRLAGRLLLGLLWRLLLGEVWLLGVAHALSQELHRRVLLLVEGRVLVLQHIHLSDNVVVRRQERLVRRLGTRRVVELLRLDRAHLAVDNSTRGPELLIKEPVLLVLVIILHLRAGVAVALAQ